MTQPSVHQERLIDSYFHRSARLASETGEVCGYAGQRSLTLHREARSRSNSCIVPRPRLLLHASDHCMRHISAQAYPFLYARVFRWNEMKIVRSFKHDPHPSIIPFHSFIITPSYALITM